MRTYKCKKCNSNLDVTWDVNEDDLDLRVGYSFCEPCELANTHATGDPELVTAFMNMVQNESNRQHH